MEVNFKKTKINHKLLQNSKLTFHKYSNARPIFHYTRINAELESIAKTIYCYWVTQIDFLGENGKPYKTSGGKMVWNEEVE